MRERIKNYRSNEISIVTGLIGVHNTVDYYAKELRYLSVEEMSILYPDIVPLTYRANQFKTPIEVVKQRVGQRFGLEVTDDFYQILSGN